MPWEPAECVDGYPSIGGILKFFCPSAKCGFADGHVCAHSQTISLAPAYTGTADQKERNDATAIMWFFDSAHRHAGCASDSLGPVFHSASAARAQPRISGKRPCQRACKLYIAVEQRAGCTTYQPAMAGYLC